MSEPMHPDPYWAVVIPPDGENTGVVAEEIARALLRNIQDAFVSKQTQDHFEKLRHAAGLLPRPDPEIEAARKEAWIREVQDRWHPFWTPEMEMIYGWRGSRK